MSNSVHVRTRVLPGHRIEFTSPELQDGQPVEVIVVPQVTSGSGESIVEFLKSLPSTRSAAEWEQFDKEFRAERDAWD